MGRPKLLLPLGNRPVIHRCLDTIVAAGVRDIVVVLGADSDEAASAISGMTVRTVVNGDPRSEMAESARLGLRQIGPSSTGVLVCLSDHPLVSPETIRALVNAHSKDPDSIIIPLYKGRRGHPTLFPRSVIQDIFNGKTLRDVITFRTDSVLTIEVGDEGVVLDMDTPVDYEQVKQRFA